MERSTVEDWARSSWAYLRDHWQEHLAPAGVQIGLLIVVVGLSYAAFAVFGLSFLFVDRSALYPVLGGLVGLLLILLGMEVFQPMMLGYARGTLRSMRGEGFPLSELLEGYRRSPSVLILTLAQSTLSLVAALFCFFPALIVGLFTSLSLVALADRDQGAVDALSTSYELVRGRLSAMALWFLAEIAAVLVVSMIPVVGSFLVAPVMTVMNVTAYLFLVKEAATGRA